MENPDIWLGAKEGKEVAMPISNALKDVESTAKALEGVNQNDLPLARDTASNIVKEYKQAQKEVDSLNKEKGSLTDAEKDAIVKKSGYVKSNKYPGYYEFSTGASVKRKTKQEIIDAYYDKKIKAVKKDAPNEKVLELYRNQDRAYSTPQKISEAYHKAKKDGTNPELVKAVEELLGGKEVAMPKAAEVQVEQYKPITKKNIEIGKFSKDEALDYEEDEKELDSGRMSTYISSMTVDVMDEDGNSIGNLIRLKDEDGIATYQATDIDGNELTLDEFDTKDEAIQALLDAHNKQAEKEFNKEQKRLAKEREKQAAKKQPSAMPDNTNADIANRIRNKKQKGALSAIDFGISVTIYNGALDFMASQVDKGTKLGNAIANTIKWIDEKMAGAKWNKGAFGKYMNDTYSVTLPNGREVEVVRDDSKETAEVINGWYSELEQKILDSKEDRLPAATWAKRLKSKEDEDVWTGLRSFLESKKPSEQVSKKELRDWMKNNRVEISEVVKGEGYVVRDSKADKDIKEFNDYEEAADFVLEEKKKGNDYIVLEKDKGKSVKFEQYQLEGDKENYKEVLVTLPRGNNLDIISNEIYQKQYSQLNPEERVSVKRKARERGETVDESNLFKSSHFDEPNILVHLRMNTRTDANGNKVLFLEEVQSDWAQSGRREGFFDEKRLKELDDKVLSGKELSKSEQIEYEKLDKIQSSGKQTTPSAPFVTDTNSWTKLGLKVALREAVKQGADKIAWTTGEQQNDRYDLSKQVDRIVYAKNEDGTYRVYADKNNSKVFDEKSILEKDLEVNFGKDVAKRIIENAGEDLESNDKLKRKVLKGENLSVGGKGMKGFYGSPSEGNLGIVGNVAKSLFKQEPGTVNIEISDSKVDLDTPPSISKSGDGRIGVSSPFEGEGKVFDAEQKQEALAYLREQKLKYDAEIAKRKTSTQYSIDITPEMRESVEKGLPLFGTKLSPEQELKAAFDKWKEEAGKMGIAPNWEKQAKADIELFRAVANYIRTKLATGAYSFDQFIKDLGKTKIENIDRDKANWEKFYNKTVEESKPLEGKAVKAAVEKAAGIKRSTKSEVQRIIDRAFAIGVGEGTQKGFVKGATEGMKAGAIEGRTQAVDMLRNALANLSGELTPKQISAIVERMGRLKTFSEAAKQNFIDYADKVIDDANYAAKEKKAAEIKNAVKKISNRSNVAANDQSLYKSFASLSISHLSASDLDVYIEWGQKIKNRALKPGDRAALSSFIEKAQERQNAIVQERSEKMKEGRMRNLRAEFDEMEAAGTLPQGISTFQEYVDSKKPKPKGETLEDKITAIDERLNEIPEGENEMIDKLRNVDLSVLNKEDLTLIDNSLYNYIDTGKLYGIGDPLVKAEYLGRVKAAVESGLKTRRQVDRRDVEKLGMSNLFTTLGETKDVASRLRGLLVQPWLSAATKANSRYIEIEAALMAKADRLKIKQPNWNRIDLFGFLNEGEGNTELFEKLKEQKLSDLETLREKVETNERDKDNSGTAQAQKYAYDALNQAIQSLGLNKNSTLESIREKLSENELAFYNETRKHLDQYSPKAIENMELYGNKEVGMTKNYWPRTTNRINEKTAGIDVFDLYGSEYVGKNMFGREKGRSRLLGKAGYYTPVGQENYFNGLKETMLIAEAAHEYHGMQALYNTTDKGFSQLIKGAGANDLKQLMIDWIMDTKNVGRYQGGVAKVGEDILNAIQKGFTRALINNPTQVFKQPTALGYTFSEAPKPFFKAIGLIAQAMMEGKDSPLSKAINGLFETTTLGQRLYHPEIIEVKEKYTIDKPEVLRYIQQFLKGFNARIGGNLLVPTDAVVSQVATLTGYIQQAERSGKSFNIFKEAEKGYDMAASAAADQMQAKTNNENAAIYFSRRQLNNRALYYLGNFQANAVRNLYISIRKIVSGRTKQEVKEGLQGVAGYIFSASLFVGAGMLSSYLVTASAFSLYQEIMNALGDDEDDEKEKRRILKYLDSRQLLNLKRKAAGEAISVATGIYGTMARAALEATLAGLEQAYYKSTPDEEKPADRIFFTPEATGYAGVVADNIISPLEMTAKASDPQMEAMAQTGLLGAKILGQSAMGFYTQNLLNAKKLAEKEAKARKEEQAEALQQKAFPKKKKLSEAKKQWTQSIEQGDVTKAKEAFNSIVKLSDDTPYITAIELRESFYKDKVKPSIISKEDEYIWFGYLFNNKFGDKIIGSEKLKNLVPPSEKEKYIEEYKKELAKIHKMTSVMNKTIKVKNVRGKIVDWSAPFDWVKQVKDKVGNK
jgi:hypothetical protein